MTMEAPTMADQYNQTLHGRNHYLISMAAFGIVAMLGGLIWALIAYRLSPTDHANPLLLIGIVWGGWLSGFGLLLLVIAWTVAAARHGRERISDR
jgi:hypothetical protein